MNKTTAIAILAALIIGMIMGGQIGCYKGRVTSGEGREITHTDTIIHQLPRHDTIWTSMTQTKNIPYMIWGHDTVIVHHVEKISGHDTILTTTYQTVSDTVAYADTLRQRDAFMAVLVDTISGNRILSRRVLWANLSPIETMTVTHTLVKKSSLVKVYIGADASGGRAGGRYHLDLAPATSVVIADRYMVDLGYYIFDQQITAGVKVKLSFRK